MASVKINEFDMLSGNWDLYTDRLEMYFLVNTVKEELKVPTLISMIGETGYELMVNLCSPNKPSTMKYDDIKNIMKEHLEPKSSILTERFRFRQCRQKEGQSVSEFVTELKRLARSCDFGQTLNENMRDQFVCGLHKEEMRHRIFVAADKKIDFEKAVTLAKIFEGAERDALCVQGGGVYVPRDCEPRDATPKRLSLARTSEVNRLDETMFRQQGGACTACGDTRHTWNECRFRTYACDHCTRRGHLRRMCPQLGRNASGRGGSAGWGPAATARRGARGRGRATYQRHAGAAGTSRGQRGDERGAARAHYVQDEDGEPRCADEMAFEDEPTLQMSLKQYEPVRLSLLVCNRQLVMEVDTGSALSCISRRTFEREFSDHILLPCNLTLSFYNGSKIHPLGYLEVDVKYKNVKKKLDLYVIEGGTTTLLGRQWLTEMNIVIPLLTSVNKIEMHDIDRSKYVNEIFSRYKQLFDGGLGRFAGGRASLRVRAGAEPVFCRARPMPYALRGRVDAELDAMLRAGVIEPVDCSDWATPLVIATKPDGGIRICADFKVTLNRVLAVDKYPVPKIEDLLTNISGSMYYSKLDLSQAYNQVVLDDSKRYTVINTHRGLFMYNRLVYGLASSPGIFQRIMTNLLGDIPNVVIFLDDILIFGDLNNHMIALNKVLNRLQENGLKIKREKCTFFAEKVKYLGYIIDRNGISTDYDKIKPILEMAEPKNASELRSFLGMVNFYGRFIKQLSFIVTPLNALLRKDRDWIWGTDAQRAFEKIKGLLAATEVLAHYDGSRPLTLTCDASAHGLGAVLAQRDAAGSERPVAYASRALTPAELNYSQIHKEALAIVYAVKKFHQYLFGRHFQLRTDHKPLLSIFNPGAAIPSMTASRLQRWALTLSAYDFTIEYVNTDNNTADALSRMIAKYKEEGSQEHTDCPEQTYLHFASEALLLDHNVLRKETSGDPLLGRVMSYIRDGWPKDVEIKELKPYFNRRSELYTELGCIMWGHRVVVPNACREKVLKELHDSHMGIVRTKSIARSYVWWPGIDEAVERVCRSCDVCAQTAAAPPAHAPRSWHWPDRPWTRLHLDFLGPIGGSTYLVVVDACSKWIEVVRMHSTTAGNVISKLREIWSRFGLPKQVVSDNGPPFSSEGFENFLRDNGIEHTYSAPYHPSSNGAAESAVKICKKIIKKAILEKKDVDTALCRSLLVYRNTEHSTTGETPAQLLQGRSLRMRLDCVKPDRSRAVRAAQARQERAAGGAQRTLNDGESVWFRTYRLGQKWAKGRIVRHLGDTDYQLVSDSGVMIHRHVDQLRKRTECNLEDPIVKYPPFMTTDDQIKPVEGVAEASTSSVSAESSASPLPAAVSLTKEPHSGGSGHANDLPTSDDAQQTISTPSNSSPGNRTQPKRQRKPPVRFRFEID